MYNAHVQCIIRINILYVHTRQQQSISMFMSSNNSLTQTGSVSTRRPAVCLMVGVLAAVICFGTHNYSYILLTQTGYSVCVWTVIGFFRYANVILSSHTHTHTNLANNTHKHTQTQTSQTTPTRTHLGTGSFGRVLLCQSKKDKNSFLATKVRF